MQSSIKLFGKNAALESGMEKNIVCNEGTEKKFPEHKDSIKKHLSYRKSPPPNQKLNARPLTDFFVWLPSW